MVFFRRGFYVWRRWKSISSRRGTCADCTGYGSCDCDEKNYGYRGGGSSGGSSGDNSGCLILVALIVASIVAYSISEILGTILLIVLVIVILCTR